MDHRSKPKTEEHKKRISESMRKVWKNKDSPLKGREQSVISNKLRSETMKQRGYGLSEKGREINRKRMSKQWIVTFPDGHEEEITNLKKFCEEKNLDSSCLRKTDKGKLRIHKGFTCKVLGD